MRPEDILKLVAEVEDNLRYLGESGEAGAAHQLTKEEQDAYLVAADQIRDALNGKGIFS